MGGRKPVQGDGEVIQGTCFFAQLDFIYKTDIQSQPVFQDRNIKALDPKQEPYLVWDPM